MQQQPNSSSSDHSIPTKDSGGGIPQEKVSGKASNFLIRTLTGILFVGVMVGGILYSPITCAFLFFVITILTTWEFTGVVNLREDTEVNRFITTVAAAAFYLGCWGYAVSDFTSLAFLPWLLSIVYLLISELYLQRSHPLQNWAMALMAQLYVALPFSLLLFILHASDLELYTVLHNEGYQCVLAIFIFLWCSDTGAYCCGSLLGKHKLFPRVSPGKTWEGSVGGGIVTVAASQIVACYAPVLTPWQWAGFALVVVVFGTWGDLVESLLKRYLGIKDSGHILPGHGGMLDRFDSSLIAIPACFVYLCILGYGMMSAF